jgi:hypothetical protein
MGRAKRQRKEWRAIDGQKVCLIGIKLYLHVKCILELRTAALGV